MKLKLFAAPALLALTFASASAQTSSPFGKDSIRCIENLSLMTSYFNQGSKTGNFKDAVGPWEAAYKDCPASHVSLYVYGPYIVAWEMAQAKTPADKKKYFDEMMGVYDNRIKYFGNDEQHPAYYIRGRKAFDYITYIDQVSAADPMKKQAYEWLKQTIKEGGADNEINVFYQYYLLSEGVYKKSEEIAKKNPTAANRKTLDADRQQFVDDYLNVTNLLAKRVDQGDEADSTYDQLKGAVDQDFGQSGAANCQTLNAIYAGQLEAKKNDADFLNMVVKLYDMADCDNSATYFKAAEYLYKLQPTYTAACGLAAQAFNKKDINGAISYLNQAATLTKSGADKSNIMLKISSVYNKRGETGRAREYARKALTYNSSNGYAYLMIAQLYANSARSISSNALVQQTAFWAAADKAERAKQVDPRCAGQANKLLSIYKRNFPSKTQVFMQRQKCGLPATQGASYTVPGWIGESTTARFNK
jgi:tetratricopeptide (TPR) repeat protein